MIWNFSLFMDVSMLALLGATVLLAFRLTISLRNFKESRFEMEGLVNRLTANITQAEKAIGGMQLAARNAGKELDEIISDAKTLSGELTFMNEAGNNLADRLEKLAERNRAFVDKIEATETFSNVSSSYREPVSKGMARSHGDFDSAEDLVGGFAIHDRDYTDDIFNDDDDLDFGPMEAPGLQSQAERELFEALQTRGARQRKAAGGNTQ